MSTSNVIPWQPRQLGPNEPRRRLAVTWVDPALALALEWAGNDDDRWAVKDAFIDLVRACQAIQVARAAIEQSEADLRAIETEHAEVRAELARLRGEGRDEPRP